MKPQKVGPGNRTFVRDFKPSLNNGFRHLRDPKKKRGRLSDISVLIAGENEKKSVWLHSGAKKIQGCVV